MTRYVPDGIKRRNFKDAGRVCPVDYRIAPDAFRREPLLSCDTLYIVGGLYGNPFALDSLDSLVAAEEDTTLVVLNGDVHWFDRDAEDFSLIEQRTASYVPLVGNVELELRRESDVGVGCGCSYPDCFSDADVSRSNRIHAVLAAMVNENSHLKERLQERPATEVVKVGDKKVAITHGDEKLVGGWDCSRESLQDVLRQDELNTWMEQNRVEVLATTHTCAPAALVLEQGAIINNGAAGMPNFLGQKGGIITRVSKTPHPRALYSTQRDDIFIEAVSLQYDDAAFLEWFDARWSALSPAAISYRDRIMQGPLDYLEDALLGGFVHQLPDDSLALRRNGTVRWSIDGVDHALASLMYFEDMLEEGSTQTSDNPETLQVNVGKLCNLSCEHCHVEAGPLRHEIMERKTFEAILAVLASRSIKTLDITGGAPEMNPHFEWFIARAAALDVHIIVRTNLVVLLLKKYQHLIALYAQLGIELIASLPNLDEGQVANQRGSNTFNDSIKVLKMLNEKGYGQDSRLVLNLVYNPQWPLLPPQQEELGVIYKRRLKKSYGIEFNEVFAVTNIPVGRYGLFLLQNDQLNEYLELLMDAFNPEAAQRLMCLNQISVDYRGIIFDCDFNQALELHHTHDTAPLTIFDYADDPSLSLKRSVLFGGHCYGCAAGFGSSCTGTLVQGE